MTNVVTAFLVRPATTGIQVLVLRRSDKVGSYRGLFAGISGYLETAEPLDQALTEIGEEVGLPPSAVHLLASAPPIEVRDEAIGRLWRVYPFLFETDDPDAVRLDWEHTEMRWVDPDALRQLDTVPGLADALDILLERWREHSGPATQAKAGNAT